LKIQDIERRVAVIDEDLKKEREEPTEKVDGSIKRKAKVKLVINAEDDHEAEISLTYRESKWHSILEPTLILIQTVVNNVRWESAFDLRATTNADGKVAPKMAVHYRASIVQSTGEDWEGVILTLSTALPTINTSIPVLKNIKIKPFGVGGGLFGNKHSGFGGNVPNNVGFGGFGQQQQQQQQQQQTPMVPRATGGLFGQTPSQTTGFGGFGDPDPSAAQNLFGSSSTQQPAMGASLFGQPTLAPVPLPDEDGHEEIGLPEMELPSAVASENAVAATFQVKGTTSVPSDSVSHKVALAVLNLQAKIEQIAVPRSIVGAYIQVSNDTGVGDLTLIEHSQCTVNNSSNTHLLPGKLSLFLDEGYIANSSIRVSDMYIPFSRQLLMTTSSTSLQGKPSFAHSDKTILFASYLTRPPRRPMNHELGCFPSRTTSLSIVQRFR